MHGSAPVTLAALVRKLTSLEALSADELECLSSLPLRPERVRTGATIVREGQKVTECCLLLEGYACRHKLSGEGGRQIVSFHLAGDILDLQHLLFDRADHNVQTITDAELVFFPIAQLRQVVDTKPAIARALWRDCLVDASIFREWVLNVGRRDAKSRVAHMLCEFLARREAAGLGSPERVVLPMNQEQIGDATGLTSVHVNRMLRELREQGIISGGGRTISIADWGALQRVADFRPQYLHLAA